MAKYYIDYIDEKQINYFLTVYNKTSNNDIKKACLDILSIYYCKESKRKYVLSLLNEKSDKLNVLALRCFLSQINNESFKKFSTDNLIISKLITLLSSDNNNVIEEVINYISKLFDNGISFFIIDYYIVELKNKNLLSAIIQKYNQKDYYIILIPLIEKILKRNDFIELCIELQLSSLICNYKPKKITLANITSLTFILFTLWKNENMNLSDLIEKTKSKTSYIIAGALKVMKIRSYDSNECNIILKTKYCILLILLVNYINTLCFDDDLDVCLPAIELTTKFLPVCILFLLFSYIYTNIY